MHLRTRARHGSVLMLIALMAITAFSAAPASAKGMSGKQRAHARAKLLKQIKRHPRLIRNKSFVRRAALVNFKLPVSIRLREGDVPATPANEAATNNTNRATINLGPSLGQREVEVGGTLIGQITFKDSYDGGALGNVEVDLLPSPESSPFGLRTTSVPLLWNDQTNSGSSTSWLTNDPGTGCGNFTGNANVGVPGYGVAPYAAAGYSATNGLPVFSAAGVAPYASWLSGTGPLPNAGTTVDSYLNNVPGVDGVNRLAVSKAPGDNDALGGNVQPFPYAPSSVPGGFVQPPDIHNTVLRTNALALQVAQPGTEVDWAFPPDGAGQGSQNYVIGKSGGQANLFGNIPGKSYGIDVKVNLATKINSIMRMVDPDFQAPVTGQPWPSTALACRQVWTGYVQNYLLGITLAGNLKIAPGITNDGHLRIAKATLNGVEPYRIPLAACLQPSTPYAAPANSSDSAPISAPTQPLNSAAVRPAPTTPCNSAQDQLLASMGVGPLSQASVANGYTVPFTGGQVTITGDIAIDNIVADVLIGDIFG
jgi:hypothetical protein